MREFCNTFVFPRKNKEDNCFLEVMVIDFVENWENSEKTRRCLHFLSMEALLFRVKTMRKRILGMCKTFFAVGFCGNS